MGSRVLDRQSNSVQSAPGRQSVTHPSRQGQAAFGLQSLTPPLPAVCSSSALHPFTSCLNTLPSRPFSYLPGGASATTTSSTSALAPRVGALHRASDTLQIGVCCAT